MRVIAGTARSIPLKAPAGMETRPTADKIKETLFNIIQFDVQGAVFLDIFAGSGAIGIEALSRGASSAVFVDSSRQAEAVIKENVVKCGFSDKSRIIKADASAVSRYISGINDAERLIIFMDPPYNKNLEFKVLELINASGIIKDDTVIIVEEALDADISEAERCGFEIYRVKEYKNQKHVFLRKA